MSTEGSTTLLSRRWQAGLDRIRALDPRVAAPEKRASGGEGFFEASLGNHVAAVRLGKRRLPHSYQAQRSFNDSRSHIQTRPTDCRAQGERAISVAPAVFNQLKGRALESLLDSCLRRVTHQETVVPVAKQSTKLEVKKACELHSRGGHRQLRRRSSLDPCELKSLSRSTAGEIRRKRTYSRSRQVTPVHSPSTPVRDKCAGDGVSPVRESMPAHRKRRPSMRDNRVSTKRSQHVRSEENSVWPVGSSATFYEENPFRRSVSEALDMPVRRSWEIPHVSLADHALSQALRGFGDNPFWRGRVETSPKDEASTVECPRSDEVVPLPLEDDNSLPT